ncbi:MAG: rod shape-determining protein MreC [Firmicutes bacterium]|nr:rod shape-determining protein MreC [Bacillota bacterium]
MRKRRRMILKYKVYFLLLLLFSFLLIFSSYRSHFSFSVFRNLGSVLQKLFINEKVDYINISNDYISSLEKENQELKKLNELKTTFATYELIFSTVVFRDFELWNQTITIDAGEEDGIKKNMAVINNDGLVGKVIDVGSKSSVVELLTSGNDKNKVSVTIYSNNKDFNGIITGYDSKNNSILVSSIRDFSEIEIGSLVKTNGIGTLFPSDILIGEVVGVELDDLGVGKIIKVKSKVDFSNLKFVSILLKRGE